MPASTCRWRVPERSRIRLAAAMACRLPYEAPEPTAVAPTRPERNEQMSPERTLNLVITAVVAAILIVILLMLLDVIAGPF
jgi:hypothetical protein